MTKDEIIDLADKCFVKSKNQIEFIQIFADAVASAERERILDICKEGLWDAEGIRYHLDKQERGQP